MNPLVTIFAAALFTGAVGVMVTQDPEVDTWGLVSASTAYSPVEAGTPPDAMHGSDQHLGNRRRKGPEQTDRNAARYCLMLHAP